MRYLKDIWLLYRHSEADADPKETNMEQNLTTINLHSGFKKIPCHTDKQINKILGIFSFCIQIMNIFLAVHKNTKV